MKYTYAYKTSDGKRHEAAMDAPSREVVFAELRKQGIKAIKVVAADGSKANGAPAPSTRHQAPSTVIAIGALCLVLCASVAVVIAFRAGEVSSDAQGTKHIAQGTTFLTDQTRRQVIGDAAIIEKGIRTGWADVFEHEGDRFLASFAIPGVKAGVGTTSVQALEEVLSPAQGTKHEAQSTKHKAQGTTIEAQQIIAMVEGMKREARAYLAAGGTLVEYGKRLTERQDAEIAVYKRVEAEILSAYARISTPAQSTPHPAQGTKHNAQSTPMTESAFTRLYEQRNDELRNLGIRPITLPEKAD